MIGPSRSANATTRDKDGGGCCASPAGSRCCHSWRNPVVINYFAASNTSAPSGVGGVAPADSEPSSTPDIAGQHDAQPASRTVGVAG